MQSIPFVKNLTLAVSSLLVSAVMMSAPVQAEPAKADMAKPVVAEQQQLARVNINTADAQTLADKLNGVGLKKAEAIVAYRQQNGAFKTVEDLVNVPGIGEATLAKNKDIISLN